MIGEEWKEKLLLYTFTTTYLLLTPFAIAVNIYHSPRKWFKARYEELKGKK